MSKACILVVDDRADIRLSATFVLEDNNFEVMVADSPYQAKLMIEKNAIDLVLLDMNYSLDTTSGDEGLSFLAWLQKNELDIPAVAMTAWSNVELAVKAMQLGAGDFIEKPWKNQRLLQVIKQQLTLSGLHVQNKKLSQRLASATEHSQGYQWQSPCMVELLQQIERVAKTDVPILLTGDNGTGKSELARHIHLCSNSNTSKPFISVNMGAISESLFESEMFGHKKGAFTDAKESRIGRFELAKNGTLFLDEIANIPLSQQAKLLRVLESGEYEVLGSSKTEHTHIRIISASNSNFSQLIAKEQFREDLFYRLNTLEFKVPSLKERQQDIIPLAEYFITLYSKKYHSENSQSAFRLCSSTYPVLKDYHWPGNIRELSHLIERAVLLAKNNLLKIEDLNLSQEISLSSHQTSANASRHSLAENSPESLTGMTLAEAEQFLIQQALKQTENNIPKAAILLGLTKSSMYRRIEKYES